MRSERSSFVSLVLLSVVIVISTAAAGNAQTQRRLTSTPRSFQTFFANFKNAVLRSDKRAVASMASFPFSYGWDAGDEGTYSRKQFLARYNDMFRGTRRLFSKANPTFSVDGNSLSLLNEEDASAYTFEKKGSKYYLTSFMVEP